MSSPTIGPPVPGLANDSNAPAILAIIGTFAGLSMFMVLLRIYVRAFMLKTFGMDDGMIIVATLCCIGNLVDWVGFTHIGIGRWDAYITLDDLSNIFHWNFFNSLIIVCGIVFVKLSLGFMLLRFVSKGKFRIVLWGLIVFLVCFMMMSIFTLVFACIPTAAYWDFTLQASATCYSKETFTSIGLLGTSLNIVTDFVFGFLTALIIWRLNLNTKTKITLILILSLGFFACAASMVKLSYQLRVLFMPDRFRWNLYSIWDSIELNAGIIAASLPCLKPLVRRGLSSTTGRSGASSRLPYHHASGSGNVLSPVRHKFYRQDDGFVMETIPKSDTRVRISVASPTDISSESQEDILQERDHPGHQLPLQGIVKTTDFSITRTG